MSSFIGTKSAASAFIAVLALWPVLKAKPNALQGPSICVFTKTCLQASNAAATHSWATSRATVSHMDEHICRQLTLGGTRPLHAVCTHSAGRSCRLAYSSRPPFRRGMLSVGHTSAPHIASGQHPSRLAVLASQYGSTWPRMSRRIKCAWASWWSNARRPSKICLCTNTMLRRLTAFA